MPCRRSRHLPSPPVPAPDPYRSLFTSLGHYRCSCPGRNSEMGPIPCSSGSKTPRGVGGMSFARRTTGTATDLLGGKCLQSMDMTISCLYSHTTLHFPQSLLHSSQLPSPHHLSTFRRVLRGSSFADGANKLWERDLLKSLVE